MSLKVYFIKFFRWFECRFRLGAGAIVLLLLYSLLLVDLSVSSVQKMFYRHEEVFSHSIHGVFKSYKKGGKGSARSLKIETLSGKHIIQFWGGYASDIQGPQLNKYLDEIIFIKYIRGPDDLFRYLHHPYSIITERGEVVFDVDKELVASKAWDIIWLDYLIIFLMLATAAFTAFLLLARLFINIQK